MARLGSVKYQCGQLMSESGIFQPGESRHEMKEGAREELAEQGLSATPENLAQVTPITSYGAAETYGKVWIDFAQYAKEEFGVKDIQNLNSEHAQAYLESKIEDGVKHSYYSKMAAGLEKMGQALDRMAEKNGIERSENLHDGIKATREDAAASLDKSSEARAYEQPERLVAAIERDDHRLAGQIQLEAGGRVHEVSQIRETQLRGVQVDPHTGREVGVVHLDAADTKGGHQHDLKLSVETYRQLESEIKNAPTINTKGGEVRAFKIDKIEYSNAVRAAAIATGHKPSGTHGLRHNFAQNRMGELQRSGQTYEAALKSVSKEMGHHRPDITETYTR